MAARPLLPLLSALFLTATSVAQENDRTPSLSRLHADLVVRDAQILTVDPEQPRATAFAVRDGRFLLVGGDADVAPLIGPDTEVLGLDGATIVPGFIDAHCHPNSLHPAESIHHIVDLGPDTTPDLDALIERLRAKAALTPKGGWIRGRGYQDTKLGRHPTRADLDRVSTEHYIQITHSSGHVGSFNSNCLEEAGIDRDTRDPAGGAFDRDADGVPNGVARETAKSVVRRKLPRSPSAKFEDRVIAYGRRFDQFASVGLTSVGDAGCSPSKLRLYREVHRRGGLVRVNAMIRSSYLDEVVDMGIQAPFGDHWLRLGGIKLFHGNSLSGRTCWLYEPYANDPEYFGIPPRRDQIELDELIARIHEAGLQACVHSNGDREIDMVLDAYDKALKNAPRLDHRHRIEHGSIVNARILDRMRDLNVVYVPHSYVYEHGDKMHAYGEKRWNWMHANRSALERGIPVAGNSDYPVSAAIPMLRIQSLCTRKTKEGVVYGPDQILDFERALWTFTMGGAFASFEEHAKGSITEGRLADFVVLDRDPLKTPADRLAEIGVRRTYVGGRLSYPRD